MNEAWMRAARQQDQKCFFGIPCKFVIKKYLWIWAIVKQLGQKRLWNITCMCRITCAFIYLSDILQIHYIKLVRQNIRMTLEKMSQHYKFPEDFHQKITWNLSFPGTWRSLQRSFIDFLDCSRHNCDAVLYYCPQSFIPEHFRSRTHLQYCWGIAH